MPSSWGLGTLSTQGHGTCAAGGRADFTRLPWQQGLHIHTPEGRASSSWALDGPSWRCEWMWSGPPKGQPMPFDSVLRCPAESCSVAGQQPHQAVHGWNPTWLQLPSPASASVPAPGAWRLGHTPAFRWRANILRNWQHPGAAATCSCNSPVRDCGRGQRGGEVWRGRGEEAVRPEPTLE